MIPRATKPHPTIPYHFAALPIDVLNDQTLQAVDVRAFAVMLDASRGGICQISERRLGDRIFRSEDTARRVIRRLEKAGWIQTIDDTNGRCHVYRLLTPSTNAEGCHMETPCTDTGASATTSRTDALSPLHECGETPGTRAGLPRRSLYSYPRDDGQEKKDDDGERDARDHDRLMELLAQAGTGSGNEEEVAVNRASEADRLLRRWPRLPDRDRLLGLLAFAVTDPTHDGKNLAQRIAWADEQTRRGESVRHGLATKTTEEVFALP